MAAAAPVEPPIERVAAAPPPVLLDDARWERVLAATGGWAAACYQCGLCSGVCPWGRVRALDAPPVSVRQMVRAAQLGLGFDALPASAPLWRCTTCRLCEVRCPRGVPVTEVVLGLRELAWQEPWLSGQVPPALAGVLWDIHWDGNPWGRPPSQRTAWARDLALPAFDPAAHEALYYVGCTAAYDRRAQQVARALVNVLRAAGVAFGTLGEAEPCCGDAAHSFGQRGYFAELVEGNTRLFRERAAPPSAPESGELADGATPQPTPSTGPRQRKSLGSVMLSAAKHLAPRQEILRSAQDDTPGQGLAPRGTNPLSDTQRGRPEAGGEVEPPALVTTSPHCYDVFEHYYPGLRGVFRPLHYSQYLAELIEAGRLTFAAPLPLRVTFHDPCVLGRGNGEYEGPRRVLQAIPGLELVEMAANREAALCCGGGGGRMWLETPAAERFAPLRLEQAEATGAAVLATACPYCIACLEDAVKVAASGRGAPQPAAGAPSPGQPVATREAFRELTTETRRHREEEEPSVSPCLRGAVMPEGHLQVLDVAEIAWLALSGGTGVQADVPAPAGSGPTFPLPAARWRGLPGRGPGD